MRRANERANRGAAGQAVAEAGAATGSVSPGQLGWLSPLRQHPRRRGSPTGSTTSSASSGTDHVEEAGRRESRARTPPPVVARCHPARCPPPSPTCHSLGLPLRLPMVVALVPVRSRGWWSCRTLSTASRSSSEPTVASAPDLVARADIGLPRRGHAASARIPRKYATRRTIRSLPLAVIDATDLPSGFGTRGPGPSAPPAAVPRTTSSTAISLARTSSCTSRTTNLACRRLSEAMLGDLAYDLRHRHPRLSVGPSSSPNGLAERSWRSYNAPSLVQVSTDGVRLHELSQLRLLPAGGGAAGASSSAADQAQLRLASLLREADRGA